MKNKDNTRTRCFNVVFYGSSVELNKILILNIERISHYAFISHDKDTYDDDILDENNVVVHKKGDLKKVHYHVLLDFYNAHSFSSVKKMFTTDSDNPRVEKVNDRSAFFRYLTHKDNKDKYHYKESDIVSNDIDYYRKIEKVGDKTHSDIIACQIVDDLINKVPLQIMCQRYGRDFIIHYSQYKDMAFFIKEENRLNGYTDENMPF